MLITHLGKSPRIDPSAYVAPNAVLCGDVTVGPAKFVYEAAAEMAEVAAARMGGGG